MLKKEKRELTIDDINAKDWSVIGSKPDEASSNIVKSQLWLDTNGE